jgi:hypothetical protein
MFFRNPAHCETMMREVKTLQGKWGNENRHTQNMTVWKVMINEHKNMHAGVYWNYLNAPGCKLCMVKGRDKNVVQKDLMCSCSAIFCLLFYTSLYSTMTSSILCLHFRHHIEAATEFDR